MSEQFFVRRDNSSNNVPTVGYNDGVDAQDVILFGACKVTEQLAVDGIGNITLSNFPVSVTGETFSDESGIRRARKLDDDISIRSGDGTVVCYAGAVSPEKKTLKVYTDEARTSVISGGNVSVTYYKRVPMKVNDKGELVIEGQSSVRNVKVTNEILSVHMKTSDLQITKQKNGIMLKKEGEIPSGASSNALAVTIGDSAKDIYITNIIAYYDGTGTEEDSYVSFGLDVVNASGVATGFMSMMLPPKTKPPMQINLGETGLKIPAGGSLKFRVNDSWTLNTIHVSAFGYQYAE